jgi:hypothetical protein
MFDFPLPKVTSADYELLALRPDATPEDIRDAKTSLAQSLQAQIKALGKELEAFETAGTDEREQLLRRQQKELQERLNRVQGSPLENPEKRKQHDAAHQPASLLQLEEIVEVALLGDRRRLLNVLRRDLEAFLTLLGEPLYHPSDLTRRQFTDDFTPQPLLDSRAPAALTLGELRR